MTYAIGNTSGGSIFGTTSTVNVSIDGVPTFTDTSSTPSTTSLVWQTFSDTVTASGSTMTIAFENGDGATDESNGLDSVALVDLTPATQIPAMGGGSLALMALLLATLALVAQRRSRRR